MTMDHRFAPRTIAPARTQRARHAGRRLRIEIRRIIRMLRDLGAHIARRWRDARDLAILIRADDRQLADIGLTHSDLSAAERESRHWFGQRPTMAAAAQRRDEAMSLARTRNKTLPQAASPPLMPGAPEPREALPFGLGGSPRQL